MHFSSEHSADFHRRLKTHLFNDAFARRRQVVICTNAASSSVS